MLTPAPLIEAVLDGDTPGLTVDVHRLDDPGHLVVDALIAFTTARSGGRSGRRVPLVFLEMPYEGHERDDRPRRGRRHAARGRLTMGGIINWDRDADGIVTLTIDDPGAGPNGALLAARFTSAVPPACSPSPMQRNDPSGVGRYGAGMDLGPGCRCGMRSSGALDVEPVP